MVEDDLQKKKKKARKQKLLRQLSWQQKKHAILH